MSELIETIVSHLNDDPFRLKLRLIEFDSIPPSELFYILVLIINSLGFQLGDESEDLRKISCNNFQNSSHTQSVITPFLSIIRYEYDVGNNEFFHRLSNGDKSILYPLLGYCLTNQKEIQQELYLGTFLTPIDLPLHIRMTSKHLARLSQSYRNLQQEFRVIHKNLTNMQGKEYVLNHVNDKLRLLREEKNELINRMKNNHNIIAHDETLNRFFQMTIELRKQEIEENRINASLDKEQGICDAVQKELSRLTDYAAEISKNTISVDNILKNIRSSIAKTSKAVQSDLLLQKQTLEHVLAARFDALERPDLTTNILEDVTRQRNQISATLNSKTRELRSLHDSKSTSKILMLKRHLKAVKLKADTKELEVAQRKDELSILQGNFNKLEEEIEKHKSSSRDSPLVLPDGLILSTLSRKKSYIERVNEQNQEESEMIRQLESLEQEVDELNGTISALTNSIDDKESYQREYEERVGVVGYRRTKCDLKDAKEEVEQTDRLKENEMKEISEIVIQMKDILNHKQGKLQPMIENMKELRTVHRTIKLNHEVQKERHDKLVSKIESDKCKIEQEVQDLKFKFMKLQRLHKQYEHEGELIDLSIQRIGLGKDDDNSADATGHGPSSFSHIKESYTDEIEYQVKLCSDLLRCKEELRQNEVHYTHQRFMFSLLFELLQVKRNVRKE